MLSTLIITSTYLSAAEAARRLGVTRPTLYAYVSRGLVRSRATAGSRKREYSAEDVRALLQRKRARRDPESAATAALGVHGMPVLDSALTLIDDGRLFYRGHDVMTLARERALEDVAEILWNAPVPGVGPTVIGAGQAKRLAALPLVERFHAWLATAGAEDPGAFVLEPDTVRAVGLKILRGLAALAGGELCGDAIAGTLVRGFRPRAAGARRKIEAALIVCADHDLNVSAFTARCIASAGATPYMAITGALAALRGHRHGGHTERVADMLDEPGTPHEVIANRLRRGDDVPGVGHPLYPDGDPRAQLLLELAVDGPAAARGRGFALASEDLLGRAPSLDLGLVVLARSLRLPPEAPLALFALGRTVGWVAHILEQYDTGVLIRPRARYVGPPPSTHAVDR
jgi:citrate synthase